MSSKSYNFFLLLLSPYKIRKKPLSIKILKIMELINSKDTEKKSYIKTSYFFSGLNKLNKTADRDFNVALLPAF